MDRAVLETSSDRYVIVEYLAEGGMGAIYLGKKLGVGGFEKEVVLKQLLPEFTREPKFIDLFLREARLSASLEHANIVHTIDLVNAGDDYFMVMEYVKGADLRTLLKRVRRRHQRFIPQAGVFIGHEILEALAYAHAKTAHDGRALNLIHRDISPSNILLSGAGEVKLTDFGIAKASTHRSVFYKVKGKVGYMSPEQARGETVDARSDLFSLGVVLYEVLVGERLFVGDLMSSASQIYAQPITPPSQKRPEIPADLDGVILKALSLDPAGRFQSAEEFQEALTRVATRHRLLAGASEMAAHLCQIAGEDPAQWLKLEVLPERADATQAHGTAVLTSGTDVLHDGNAASGRRSSSFDFSDEPDEVDPDDSDADQLERLRNRPPSLPTVELTSVISVRSSAIANGDALRSRPDESPLQPLQPKRSELPGAPRRAPAAPVDFIHDESRSQTLVRESSPRALGAPVPEVRKSPAPEPRQPPSPEPRKPPSPEPRKPPSPEPRKPPSAETRKPGLSEPRKASVPEARQAAAPEPRKSAAPLARSPVPRAAETSRPNDLARTPAARAFEPMPPYESRAYGPESFAGPLSSAQVETVRRLPKSGIRDRPRGLPVNDAAARRTRPARIIGILVVLLLIGIGVALGVAFSGPEVEVVDPSVAASGSAAGPNGPAHQQVTPSQPVTPPKPTELPGPPAATSATP